MDLLVIFGLILLSCFVLGWSIIVILYGDEWIKWLIKIKLLNQDISTKSNVIKIFVIHIVFVPIGILLPITGLIFGWFLFGIEIGLLLYRLDNTRFIVRLFFVIEYFIFKRCICLFSIFYCICILPFAMVIDTTQSLFISFLCGCLLFCFIGLIIYYLSWYCCIGFSKTLEEYKNLDYKITKIASYIFVVGYICFWIFMSIYSSFYETENGFILCILGIFLFLFVPIFLRSFIKRLCFEILQTQDVQKGLD